MNTGLIDVLRGSFVGGKSIEGTSDHEARLLSVIGNLTHLFNSRKGALEHLPDYGLPDLGSLYRGMPDSVDDLRRNVRETVEKYEPRLSRIRVKAQPSESTEMHLSLVLTAELDGERVRFKTTFSSAEPVEVGEYTRRD